MEQRTRLYREVRFEGEREGGGWLVLFCVRGGPRARNKFVSKSAFALRVGGTRGKKRAKSRRKKIGKPRERQR